MKRRGVLGFLAGGIAAGPSMAKQAVAGIEATSVSGLSTGAALANYAGQQTGLVENAPFGEYDHLSHLKRRLEELTGITTEERQDRISNWHVYGLDPDLAVNRSMALWAKVAEQKRREYERNTERERKSLTRQIADFIRDQAFKN